MGSVAAGICHSAFLRLFFLWVFLKFQLEAVGSALFNLESIGVHADLLLLISIGVVATFDDSITCTDALLELSTLWLSS